MRPGGGKPADFAVLEAGSTSIRRGASVRGFILDQGVIDASAHERPRRLRLSFRGAVLIAAFLFCAAFWVGLGCLVAR